MTSFDKKITKGDEQIKEDLRLIYTFNVFLFLEITTFGLALFFASSYKNSFIYIAFGLSIVIGNYIICDAINTHNTFQLINYFFLYTFSLINTWLDGLTERGLYFSFKIAFGVIFTLRGVYTLYKINDLYRIYSFSYYKKIGGDKKLQGKFNFNFRCQ
ncbi:hypothetical protein SLOPH_1114 [Spraguea lophii 42_110]|uniref:Uncharacterized protein n=1 Tax=Spraguea lophii (strain 42_110) TaxID=1358809 RepID=S7W6V6_SPRLO|nr:hypothetical protein SLOPH_1114 [Spraguea lophii 42_110]